MFRYPFRRVASVLFRLAWLFHFAARVAFCRTASQPAVAKSPKRHKDHKQSLAKQLRYSDLAASLRLKAYTHIYRQICSSIYKPL